MARSANDTALAMARIEAAYFANRLFLSPAS
jgi:hypothetical protein